MKLKKRIFWLLKGAPRCWICKRPIYEKADVKRGIGAKCFAKLPKGTAK